MAHLANVLARPMHGRIVDEGTFRKYTAVLNTMTVVGSVPESSNKCITYEVGRHYGTAAEALARPPDGFPSTDASYPTSAVLAEDFTGYAKKYSNFSSRFEYTSLAGVVERIARGLAAASLYPEGDVTAGTLLAGNALVVHALGTYDGPVSAHLSTVFIPRLVDSHTSPDVFSILAHAVCGEGGSVATDILAINVANNTPMVPEVNEDGFAKACVDALRILGANFNASGAGDLFALALTRGLHATLTVVGHTDEGGISRDLLRCGAFAPPFGGIHCGLEEYVGLPALSTDSECALAGYVDALALKTAALVAHCDPGMDFGGVWYPTTFQGIDPTIPIARPGDSQDASPRVTAANRVQVVSDYGRFLRLYLPALSRLFGCAGETEAALRFQASVAAYLGAFPRHLAFASVNPYFWVEPTSLIPRDFVGSAAEAEGFAAKATRGERLQRPYFEDIAQVDALGDTTFTSYVVKMRGARTSAFLDHWNGHPRDGLGAISVRQMDPTGVIHPGPDATNPQVRDRVEAGAALSSYLWTRGQSALVAPGEFLNLGRTLCFTVRHVTWDDDGLPTEEHVPAHYEFCSGTVSYSVGVPTGRAAGKLGQTRSDVRRARTKATGELQAALLRSRRHGRAAVEAVPTLTTAPAFPARESVSLEDRPHGPPPVHGSGGSSYAANGVGASDPDDTSLSTATRPVPPTGFNNAGTAPPIPRAPAGIGATALGPNIAGGGGGSGGPPGGPPPPPPPGGVGPGGAPPFPGRSPANSVGSGPGGRAVPLPPLGPVSGAPATGAEPQ
ncbi:coat protein [Tolypocladium ophioglossoides totivirus 1]|nr:coat protein [Tolypocladium ophioglossoides totivirus 1]